MVLQQNREALDIGLLPLKFEQGRLTLIDQRQLPQKLTYVDASEFADICLAIKDMIIRGAPSIGVAAAFGFAMEACRRAKQNWSTDLTGELDSIKQSLDATRPTAVNLSWATRRMFDFTTHLLKTKVSAEEFQGQTLREAQRILAEHIETNLAISNYGADLMSPDNSVITHCNAGPLAVCGWGTALGVIRAAHLRGLVPHVYVDETRPRNQGAKLTMWELQRDKIRATLICDSMSGYLMSRKKIDMVITGADRIALNGDAANKIGTYNLAIVAKHHGVPFYIAAPLSTFDRTIASGGAIPIEERDASEVTELDGVKTTVPGAKALNPAFDVTPASLIEGIITEVGVLRPPYLESVGQALSGTLAHE